MAARKMKQKPLSLVSTVCSIALFLSTNDMVEGYHTNNIPPHLSRVVIQVCQNKDCCQRWKLQTPLPDVLHDLLLLENSERVQMETTSCLGQCGKGPNVCVNGEVYLRGLCDAVTVAAQLESLISIPVPSKLLAAVNVLEKAQTGTSRARPWVEN
jgi:NADH:ubiquinone oxidoreductase subunit E